MSLEQSEKNFLEKLADRIPGIKGYRAREEARDTDKRLRDYLALQMDTARRSLTEAKLAMTKAGQLDALDRVDRTERRMQRLADAIRHASYGYSGLFDQVKVREAELERIYAHDASVVGLVADVVSQAKAVPTGGDAAEALAGLEAALEAVDRRWQERKTIFDTPTP
jgi:hypothetical protein